MKPIILLARILATLAVIATIALSFRVDPLISLCLAVFIGAVMLEGVAQEGMR